MVSNRLFHGLTPVFLALCLTVSCGKDGTGHAHDPYRDLAQFDWVHRAYRTVDGQQIVIATTFKFNENRTYSKTVRGTSGSETIESYTEDEAGTYELIDNTIILIPSKGDSYTTDWILIPTSGNLLLSPPGGLTMEFENETPTT